MSCSSISPFKLGVQEKTTLVLPVAPVYFLVHEPIKIGIPRVTKTEHMMAEISKSARAFKHENHLKRELLKSAVLPPHLV